MKEMTKEEQLEMLKTQLHAIHSSDDTKVIKVSMLVTAIALLIGSEAKLSIESIVFVSMMSLVLVGIGIVVIKAILERNLDKLFTLPQNEVERVTVTELIMELSGIFIAPTIAFTTCVLMYMYPAIDKLKNILPLPF